MTILTLILFVAIAAAAAVLLAWAGYAVGSLIRDDGYRAPRAVQHTPPRSHTADVFEPRSRLA